MFENTPSTLVQFCIDIKQGTSTVAAVTGHAKNKNDISIADIDKVIEVEQMLERLTGHRVHISCHSVPAKSSGDAKFTVYRYCCRDGNCTTCLGGFDRNARKRIVHAHGVSNELADRMLAGWSTYEPEKVLEVPGV